MSNKISQREARRIRKELNSLHQRDDARERWWSSEHPGGIHIATSQPNSEVVAIVRTARKLGHYVVAVPDNNEARIRYYSTSR